jgi:hypothetical protein
VSFRLVRVDRSVIAESCGGEPPSRPGSMVTANSASKEGVVLPRSVMRR